MRIKVLPAFHGDCFIISFEDDGLVRNILIDGGPRRTYRRFLKPELEKIITKSEQIDLLIITHIDDDHIGGIIEMFEDVEFIKNVVQEVWFNSGLILSTFFDAALASEREISMSNINNTDMSFSQGNSLEKSLESFGSWQRKLLCAETSPIRFFNSNITILSPDVATLQDLNMQWDVEKEDRDTRLAFGRNDYRYSIDELKLRPFKEDKSLVNRSSLALVIEHQRGRLLLLADSHPSVVANSLRKHGYKRENKLEIDFIKVSHHGSKGNTSSDLLDLISCRNYIISTDGSRGIPSKEALSRIISSQIPPVRFFFNYSNDRISQIFSKSDIDKYNFTISYLNNQLEPLSIDINAENRKSV
jgi:beta-lactamase superfamily II metal-dependent hydrolase